jgi:3-phenylpropionate/trans-cinnamate dioxygenase ferredoxin reductase component
VGTLDRYDHVIVVGGGIAAKRIVEEYRRLGGDAAVTLVSAEQVPPYDRPPLSKQVLRGELGDTTLRADWRGWGVELRLGVKATALDPDRSVLLLDDGAVLPYDALVIATGADPRPLVGLQGEGVHQLRTIGDATALAADIRAHGHVTVVGAGFIGCEVAASARAMNARVTLIEALPAPLARVLGTDVGAEITRMNMAAGVDVRCGTAVSGTRAGTRGRDLLLGDGDTVRADVVVVGLGVSPATGWLEGSGLMIDDGIICDPRGRTSAPAVWAAGDVARWWHPLYHEHVRMEHWTSASEQGATVARDLLGRSEPLAQVPYFWSDLYDVKIQVLGHPRPDDDVELVRGPPSAGQPLVLYGRGGRLTAVLGISRPKDVMRMRSLLVEQVSMATAVTAAQSDASSPLKM